jgi:methyl-accepting chemotaxis protein
MHEQIQEDSETPARSGFVESCMSALFGRRRTILVDPRYQLRAAGVATGTVMAAFVALVGAIHFETLRIRDAMARLDPDIARELADAAVLDPVLFSLIAGLVTAGVFLVALLESHRTAGAAYSIAQTLEAIGQGRFRVRARLRKNDHLTGLRDAVNQMAESLETAVQREAATLDVLAERMEAAKDETERAAVAGELRDVARRRREKLV